jgi:hypothetical protein
MGNVLRERGARIAVAALAVVGLLLLAGRLTAPPAREGTTAASRAGAAPSPRLLRSIATPSCDPDGTALASAGTRRAPADGPEAHPPIAGLRLDPTGPRPGDLPADRASGLARADAEQHDDVKPDAVVHARRFAVTSRAHHLAGVRAWVVAVAGIRIGQGYCGPLGTREEVLVLDVHTGRELFSYSYR